MTPDRPHVRVDPAQSFGQPAVKGISCEAIAGMVLAGELLEVVAHEYDLSRADVLVACWYLGLYGTRRWRRLWKAWASEAGIAMWHLPTVDYDTIPYPPVPEPGPSSMVDVVLPDGTHRYWSTHCRHAGPDLDAPGHQVCSATELAPGLERRPAQCKTCAAPCRCTCHQKEPADA